MANYRNRLWRRRICCLHRSFSSNPVKSISDIPSAFTLPFVGTLFQLFLAGGPTKLHSYIDNRHAQFGSIFKEQLGPISSIFISDPKEMRKMFSNEGKYPKHLVPPAWEYFNKLYGFKRGLFFMDGDEWLNHRRILNRVMLKSELTKKGNALCQEMLKNIFKKDWLNNDGVIMDLNDKTYGISIAYIVAYLLGTPFKEKWPQFYSRFNEMARVMQQIYISSVQLSLVSPELAHFLKLKAWKDFVKSVGASFDSGECLLQDIIRLKGDGLVNDLVNEGLSTDVISRIIIDFLIAAADTSAITTQWTLYLLGCYPDIQETLYDHIKQQSDDNVVDSYMLKNVLKESMRLHPIALFLNRYLARDTELCGYLIPTGHLVSFSMYSTCRNDLYFPQANKFDPSRWDRLSSGSSDGYKAVLHPYATIPYAIGGRSCIGRKISQGQLLSTIGTIVRIYKIESLNDVDMKTNLIMVPSKPIKLRFSKR